MGPCIGLRSRSVSSRPPTEPTTMASAVPTSTDRHRRLPGGQLQHLQAEIRPDHGGDEGLDLKFGRTTPTRSSAMKLQRRRPKTAFTRSRKVRVRERKLSARIVATAPAPDVVAERPTARQCYRSIVLPLDDDLAALDHVAEGGGWVGERVEVFERIHP